VGTLVMKKTVEIVHLVTRAKKYCYKTAIILILVFSKSAPLSLIWRICAQNPFNHLGIDVLGRVRVVWVLWL